MYIASILLLWEIYIEAPLKKLLLEQNQWKIEAKISKAVLSQVFLMRLKDQGLL